MLWMAWMKMTLIRSEQYILSYIIIQMSLHRLQSLLQSPSRSRLYLHRVFQQQIILYPKVLSLSLLYLCYRQHITLAQSSPFYTIHFSMSRLFSRLSGKLASLTVPKAIRRTLYSSYGGDEQEMTKSLEDFATLQEFFTREIKQRTIGEEGYVSPADCTVDLVQQVTIDDRITVKGISYSLNTLLTGDPLANPAFSKDPLYCVIYRLGKGDYHRVHSPCHWNIVSRTHITGHLKSPVLLSNERVVLQGHSSFGPLSLVMVGALASGNIQLFFDSLQTNWPFSYGVDQPIHSIDYAQQIKVTKGQQMGKFNMGSAVVMLLPLPKGYSLDIRDGDILKYGQNIVKKEKQQKE